MLLPAMVAAPMFVPVMVADWMLHTTLLFPRRQRTNSTGPVRQGEHLLRPQVQDHPWALATRNRDQPADGRYGGHGQNRCSAPIGKAGDDRGLRLTEARRLP